MGGTRIKGILCDDDDDNDDDNRPKFPSVAVAAFQGLTRRLLFLFYVNAKREIFITFQKSGRKRCDGKINGKTIKAIVKEASSMNERVAHSVPV